VSSWRRLYTFGGAHVASTHVTQQPTHMLTWSDLPPFIQNLAIIVGFVAVATYVDILLPRAGPVKLDDPHAHYVADKDYNGSWRRKKDE